MSPSRSLAAQPLLIQPAHRLPKLITGASPQHIRAAESLIEVDLTNR
jgi:hypothetical protein